MDSGERFAVLPYLRTTEKVVIRGIVFQSILNRQDVSLAANAHLDIIAKLFYLIPDARIEDWVFAVVPPGDEYQRQLVEAHSLISYLYTVPHPGGNVALPSEIASIFVLNPSRFVPPTTIMLGGFGERIKWMGDQNVLEQEDKARFLNGYDVVRDWHVRFSVTPTSRILPQLHSQAMNHFQNLANDLAIANERKENWALADLYNGIDSLHDEVRNSIFLSMRWYVKSCSDAVVEGEQIVYLATALESLLQVPGTTDVTAKLSAAVGTLLGRVDSLDEWLRHFYGVRSKLLHEGITSSTVYSPSESKTQKGKRSSIGGRLPHLEYGRRIYRLCLNSIVSSAISVRRARLASLFIPNEERCGMICRMLSNEPNAERGMTNIFELVSDLSFCWLSNPVPRDVLLKTARRVLKTAVDAKLRISEGASACLCNLLQMLKDNVTFYEFLDACEKLSMLISEECGWEGPPKTPLSVVNLTEFLKYVSDASYKAWAYFEPSKVSMDEPNDE